jgi:hypothetical protein
MNSIVLYFIKFNNIGAFRWRSKLKKLEKIRLWEWLWIWLLLVTCSILPAITIVLPVPCQCWCWDLLAIDSVRSSPVLHWWHCVSGWRNHCKGLLIQCTTLGVQHWSPAQQGRPIMVLPLKQMFAFSKQGTQVYDYMLRQEKTALLSVQCSIQQRVNHHSPKRWRATVGNHIREIRPLASACHPFSLHR